MGAMSSAFAVSVRMTAALSSLIQGGALTFGMDLAGTVDTPLVPAIPDQPPGGGGGAFGRPALEVVVALLSTKAAAATAVATPLRSANSARSCSSVMLSANIVRVFIELGGGKCWSEMLTQKQSLTMLCKWCGLVSCCHISSLMLSNLWSHAITSLVSCYHISGLMLSHLQSRVVTSPVSCCYISSLVSSQIWQPTCLTAYDM